MEIMDVLKYEGDNGTCIWKHPSEDFNTMTQLVVHQSQEAVFFRNGEALDLFGPGRYTLQTQNIPVLGKLLNLPFSGESPFHCEVYFINKTEQMAVKWGTDSKLQFLEPTYRFPIEIGACGEMNLRAADSRRLLVKLVGTEPVLDQKTLAGYFRAFLMTRVKAYLAQTIREKNISIFEIDEHLDALSEELHSRLAPDFEEYGVALERFFVTTVLKPDGDAAYEKFKSLHFRQYADVAEAQLRRQVGIIEQETEAQRTVIEAEGIARKRSLEGYTYQQERGFDVAEKAAGNEGVGSFSSAGIGLGMMAGVGSSVGSAVGGMFHDATAAAQTGPVSQPGEASSPPQENGAAPRVPRFCENCGKPLAEDAAFCEACGAPAPREKACGNCGYVFERPGKFCPKCGTKREE